MRNIITTLLLAAGLCICTDTMAQIDTLSAETTTLTENQENLNFVRKVYDNATYSQNIVSRINLGLAKADKEINLDGRLHMRRGEVIRISIVPFGLMEVGRLEFTPEYVLLIDRIHKEYVKAEYGDLDFLKANGMTFYTLQSLFWNELFQPGKEKLSDRDLALYSVTPSADDRRTVAYSQDKLLFQWLAEVRNGHIANTNITYGKDTAEEADVDVSYSQFVPLGVKFFPTKERIVFSCESLKAKQLSLDITMNGISTDSNWEATTQVSDRYTKVTAEELFAKIMSL